MFTELFFSKKITISWHKNVCGYSVDGWMDGSLMYVFHTNEIWDSIRRTNQIAACIYASFVWIFASCSKCGHVCFATNSASLLDRSLYFQSSIFMNLWPRILCVGCETGKRSGKFLWWWRWYDAKWAVRLGMFGLDLQLVSLKWENCRILNWLDSLK